MTPIFSAQVLFGTADGQVIVMDCHGRMLAHVLLHESDGIVSMSWNCPDFLVEDSTESDTDSDENVLPLGKKTRRRRVCSHLLSCRDNNRSVGASPSLSSAQGQAPADRHLPVGRHQLDEQLRRPLARHDSLRAQR